MATEPVSGNDLRVIVAGGGTGGHLFPGLAVADALAHRRRCRVTFVGSSHGIETRVVPKRGYPLRTLPVRALRGQGPVALAASVLRLPACRVTARRILEEIRPDLLVGVGGYASGPRSCAPAGLDVRRRCFSSKTRIPARRTACSHDSPTAYAPRSPRASGILPAERTILTGNPVRTPVRQDTERRGGFSVLIFGGSAGAHRLNEVGVEAMALVATAGGTPRIVHQTGAADLESVRDRYRELGLDADVRSFIDDMAAAYAGADSIVCRAGATTLAEITALGKAALLVPYPYAADDHQRKNAESLVERGAARDDSRPRPVRTASGRSDRRAPGRAATVSRRWQKGRAPPGGRMPPTGWSTFAWSSSRGAGEEHDRVREETPRPFRRHRRHRHERHRRGAAEHGLRRQRIRPRRIGDHAAARDGSVRSCTIGHRPGPRPGAIDVVVISSAVKHVESRGRACSRAAHPGDPARRDARRADAHEVRSRRGRHARQDDDDLVHRRGAGARRTRSDGRHRRQASRARHATRGSARGRSSSPRPTRATAAS